MPAPVIATVAAIAKIIPRLWFSHFLSGPIRLDGQAA